MVRDVVKINEDLCNGCGVCVPSCHEGALQIIDGKARLISDLMCDGLGACLSECPLGAITIEKREAEPYDEVKVMELMVTKGANTVIAHMVHLKEHGETGFLKQAVGYLRENSAKLNFDADEVIHTVHNHGHHEAESGCGGGCPGSRTVDMRAKSPSDFQLAPEALPQASELRQWPVQLHLINPNAPYFQGADLLVAADCTAFSLADFHSRHLRGKSLVIACPKLDSNTDVYIDKITHLIDRAKVNTITVMIMEVPCCGGLLQMVRRAASVATRKVPIKVQVIGIKGDILQEEWV